ncbi:unnamed protein product [Caenorhabditis bovis]|uniref:RanBP2-type domain-containing protein n=1 Tax=Caenorhabditis bovis TaxID=2654633 RepID=A0A8S1EIH2_9PELO|nr:unnamed protein product [Caenorhabditis bovis]
MSSRKRVRKAESDDDDDGATWACQSCTFQNRYDTFRCEMCESRRGTSTRKARLSENVVEMQKTVHDMMLKQAEKERQIRRKEQNLFRSLTPASSTRGASPALSQRSGSPNPRSNSSTRKSTPVSNGKVKKEEMKRRTCVKENTPKPESRRTKREAADIVDLKKVKEEPSESPSDSKKMAKELKMEKKFSLPLEKSPNSPPVIKKEIGVMEDASKLKPSTSKANDDVIMSPPPTLSKHTTPLKRPSAPSTPNLSPANSRQSYETDLSSDSSSSLARSLEPPSDERRQISASRRIPDYKIQRDIAKKIVIEVNGIPAVFYEFARRIPPNNAAAASNSS